MQAPSVFSSFRRAQALRIAAVIFIFVVLGSVSRYHGSFDFSIDDDGQVQSNRHDTSDLDVYHTHHIASYHSNDIKPWTEGDTKALGTPEGQKVVQYLTASPFQPPSPANNNNHYTLKSDHFSVLTKRLRVYRALWHSLKSYYDQLAADGKQDHLYDVPPANIAPAVELLQKLEQATFPWIWKHHKTSYDFYSEFKNGGRGIVMCIGNGHTKFARTAIKNLREVLKSRLPIEIYYIGDQDLSPENRAWYERFEDVKTIDIRSVVDDDMLRLGGWAIKPFALLASRFSEAILMDSDAYFLADPEVLFDDAGYKEVGTVYFYDRILFPGAGYEQKVWMESFLPTMSNHPAKTGWFQTKGGHEMESGVVVMDKNRHFLGLLAICKLNDLYERDQVTYKKTWGDKESFWIAMEMIQERYSFIPFRGGVIGNVHPITKTGEPTAHAVRVNMDRVCGNQLHFTDKGQPLWWNSGVVRDKFTPHSQYLKYTAYMKNEDGDWDFDSSCIIQKNPEAIMELEWDQRQIAFEILKADRDAAVELNAPMFKEILPIPELIRTEGPKNGNGNHDAV
ncbi:mannosyltransferase putative-domain-containing protein [Mortierella sp. GBAus27b]|nr:mannosyltransferase putative-domain-containing protein [Mortierella sp. GBAus27b]